VDSAVIPTRKQRRSVKESRIRDNPGTRPDIAMPLVTNAGHQETQRGLRLESVVEMSDPGRVLLAG
jgi:hypothetical protein